ncbi:type IV pilus biogenesis protein PilM [Kyrpidia tusciae]|uniref:Tfp pilus assembly protein ATPase PilM-like protein n=1 Tax=Kyrpidia tusciae (strain DSM 2912 / NBRC 15312 / T2) TaxID=562970 RepID=D5WWI0_KYRT2|nr:Tfp pilus assembly protein PilM [Kyrpidia tusciae]ADG07745.1 Tfp pilus assembly protein ATPase PilM-like protein [Kyrpidia tusciae DSM 2912]
MRFSLAGPSGVGVSFHEHVVEVVRVEGRGPFPLVGHALISLPPEVYENGWIKNEAAFTETFRRKIQDAGVAADRPSLCLPTSAVVLRTVTLPRTGRKQARNLLQFQIDHELHLPFANPVFDFDYFPPGFPAPDGQAGEDGGALVLLAAAPGDLVHRAEQAFRRIKTPLDAVEVKGLAGLRVLRHLGRRIDQGTLLVHFGPDAVDAHFYVKGQLLLSRWLDLNPREYVSEETGGFATVSGPAGPTLAPGAARSAGGDAAQSRTTRIGATNESRITEAPAGPGAETGASSESDSVLWVPDADETPWGTSPDGAAGPGQTEAAAGVAADVNTPKSTGDAGVDSGTRSAPRPGGPEFPGQPGGPEALGIPGTSETGAEPSHPAQPALSAYADTWLAVGHPAAKLKAFTADLQYQIDRLLSFLQYTLRQEDLALSRLWLAGYVPHCEAIAANLSDHLGLPVECLDTPRDLGGRPVDLPALGAALRGMVPDED